MGTNVVLMAGEFPLIPIYDSSNSRVLSAKEQTVNEGRESMGIEVAHLDMETHPGLAGDVIAE